MSRTERASYEAARDELGGRGCVAGGYKLAAPDGGDYPLCARHLANAWRMYTAYPDEARVVIVAVDQHTPESNAAASLAETLPGLRSAADAKRSRRAARTPPYEQGFALKLWPQRLEQPLKWSRPRMIFVNSMSDLLNVPRRAGLKASGAGLSAFRRGARSVVGRAR